MGAKERLLVGRLDKKGETERGRTEARLQSRSANVARRSGCPIKGQRVFPTAVSRKDIFMACSRGRLRSSSLLDVYVNIRLITDVIYSRSNGSYQLRAARAAPKIAETEEARVIGVFRFCGRFANGRDA